MNTYTITAGQTVIDRAPSEAAALARAARLAGKSWEDLCIWGPDGAIVAVVVSGELIRPGAVTYTPAA
jgi:hypothetical protein